MILGEKVKIDKEEVKEEEVKVIVKERVERDVVEEKLENVPGNQKTLAFYAESKRDVVKALGQFVPLWEVEKILSIFGFDTPESLHKLYHEVIQILLLNFKDPVSCESDIASLILRYSEKKFD